MFKIKNERVEIFKKLYPFIKKNKWHYLLLGGFKMYFLVLSLITPVLYMILINDVMTDKELNMLFWVILGYIAVYLLQTLGIVLNKIVYNKLFIKLNLKIKTELLSKYTEIETKDFVNYGAGDLKNRIVDDVNVFEKFLSSHCLEYFSAVTSAIVIAFILFSMNWKLSIFGFVMVPLSFLFTKVMSKKAEKVSNEYRENYGEYEGFLQSSVQNWKEIKVNNLEEKQTKILTNYWDKLSTLFIKNQIYWYINRAFISFKDFFITKMNLYFLGGLFVINGNMEVAILLGFMSYYDQFFKNILKITNLKLGLKSDRPSIDRVFEILKYPVQEIEKVNVVGDEIQLSNVYFRYDESQEMILKNINIQIKDNEHIALVGRSGCGKTTLAKLLLGIHRAETGTVTIGGKTTHAITTDGTSKKVGAVMQEPVLFNLTIRENLMFAKRSATQSELNLACQRASILDFIESLPNQFETIIGEDGIKLSGGQKQRLAIARTILFDPDIVVFDEATSSLDNENEKAILDSIKYLSKDKTIITIAHRLSSILDADRVIVMDAGEIVASGRHYELKGNMMFMIYCFKNSMRQVQIFVCNRAFLQTNSEFKDSDSKVKRKNSIF